MRRTSTTELCTTHLIVKSIIRNSAVDIAATGHDDSTGFGRLNAFRALLSIIRGDMDNDADWDTIDVDLMIQALFFNGDPGPFPGLWDVNCDGFGDSVDLNIFISTVYFNGAPPDICFVYDY